MITDNVKERLEELHISKSAIAELVGKTRGGFNSTLDSYSGLRVDEYEKICEFLGVPLDYFTDKETEKRKRAMANA